MKIPDQSDSLSLADLIITPVVAGALSGFGLLFPEICSSFESFWNVNRTRCRRTCVGRSQDVIEPLSNRASTVSVQNFWKFEHGVWIDSETDLCTRSEAAVSECVVAATFTVA